MESKIKSGTNPMAMHSPYPLSISHTPCFGSWHLLNIADLAQKAHGKTIGLDCFCHQKMDYFVRLDDGLLTAGIILAKDEDYHWQGEGTAAKVAQDFGYSAYYRPGQKSAIFLTGLCS